MSAQKLEGISGLVAANSLLAMVGGVLFALVASRNDPGFVHNGALAGLIAICAGSDLVHPIGAFFIGGIGSLIFVYGFQFEQEKLKIDDVLGVWPLHGVIGTWGGISAGIFGGTSLGGLGGVSFLSQLAGSLMAVAYALTTGFIVYFLIDKIFGFRMSQEDEFNGPDLSIHQIHAYPEERVG
jgi:Amt family ammonium transporter